MSVRLYSTGKDETACGVAKVGEYLLVYISGEQVAVGPGFLKHHILHILRIG